MMNRIFYKWITKDIHVLLLFAIYSISSRLISFFRSQIDWDESTYILGAQAFVDGCTPYVDFIDTKPIGIFYFFAPFVSWGTPWINIRIVGACLIALTSFLIFKIVYNFFSTSKIQAILAGFLYVVAISFQSYSFATGSGQGLAINTEHVTNLLIAFAIWLSLNKNYLWSGFTVGLAFSINFLIGFSALIIPVLIFTRNHWKLTFKPLLSTALGFVISTMIVVTVLWLQGGLAAYLDVFVKSSKGYANPWIFSEYMHFLSSALYTASTLIICFLIMVLLARKSHTNNIAFFIVLLIWIVLTCIGAGITAKYYFHYAIAVFLPLALLSAGCWFSSERASKWSGRIIIIILIASPFVSWYKWASCFNRPDTSIAIANYLSPKLQKDEQVFIFCQYHIVYTMLNQLPPTPYYHPSLIQKQEHIDALQINIDQEYQRIFSLKPKFVVTEPQFNALIAKFIVKDYELLPEWTGTVKIFKRRGD